MKIGQVQLEILLEQVIIFINSQTNQWEQIWLDNQGGTLHLKGNRKDNQMILQSDKMKNDKGEPYFHRITWTLNEDGSVRQYWETITNEKDVLWLLTVYIKNLNNYSL